MKTEKVPCKGCEQELPLKDAHRHLDKTEQRWAYYCSNCYWRKLSTDTTLANGGQPQ